MTHDMFGSEAQDAPDFERFWTHTPRNRRESKQKARQEWAKCAEAERRAALYDLIDLDRPNRDPSWIAGYNPAPHRYLKHKRWEDEWEQAIGQTCERRSGEPRISEAERVRRAIEQRRAQRGY